MGPIVVLLLRLIIPISIVKYPLVGGILSMIIDALDVVLIDAMGLGRFPKIDMLYNNHYHQLDKYLDMYYLSFELYASLAWKEVLARKTSIWLFIWRLIGFVSFEITQLRWILFIAPNLFENFYLFYLIMKKHNQKWVIKTKKRLFVFLLLLYLPKIPQEYFLHVRQVQPWVWIKATFFHRI